MRMERRPKRWPRSRWSPQDNGPCKRPSWTTHAKAKGWIVSGEPKPGDLFCISGDHTGLVEESRGATIVTCEGNCSNAVASIIRATHGAITHYIRPRA